MYRGYFTTSVSRRNRERVTMCARAPHTDHAFVDRALEGPFYDPGMKSFQNFVNGEFVDSAEGGTTEVVNPVTGGAYATAPLSGTADIDRAMAAAEAAFPGWRDATPSERSLALIRIADAVEARADELIALEVENCGKPAHLVASEEVPPMVDQIRFFAGAARHLEGKSAGEYMAGMTSFVRREPVGVCAQVAPWNYPMMMAIWKFAPAIAAGNTVVLKPSDTTPASTALMAEIMQEFLPPGVFNVVCGDRDTGRALVEHEIPAMASITGSVTGGSRGGPTPYRVKGFTSGCR